MKIKPLVDSGYIYLYPWDIKRIFLSGVSDKTCIKVQDGNVFVLDNIDVDEVAEITGHKASEPEVVFDEIETETENLNETLN